MGLVIANRLGVLEVAFKTAFDEVNNDIQEKIKAAAALIDEAKALSEERGMPFRPSVNLAGFSMSYIPKSFGEKFGNLDYDFMSDLTGASGEGYGWQSSQTC